MLLILTDSPIGLLVNISKRKSIYFGRMYFITVSRRFCKSIRGKVFKAKSARDELDQTLAYFPENIIFYKGKHYNWFLMLLIQVSCV